MLARDLNEIDRRIADARAHIEHEREIARRLQEHGHTAEATKSQDLLKTFEDSLEALLELRRTILKGLRRTASSVSSLGAKPQRRKRDA